MAKVSIIVPTYNVEKYLAFCVDSLVEQSLKEIEIILVDDGSSDKSGEICDDYAKKDTRIKVIHQTNRGLGLTRNSGLDIATGEYIGFVDSDDCVSKDMFRVLYEVAVKEDADIAYCAMQKFWDNSEVKETENDSCETDKWVGNQEIRKYLLDRIGLPPNCTKDNSFGASVCCGIFRKSILDDYGIKFVSERQYIAEDMIFDIDYIPKCNRVVYVDEPFYYYRYNPQSLTTVYKADRFEKNVSLYREMWNRVLKICDREEAFDSMSRYFLTFTRIAIIQEARFWKQNGLPYVIKSIKTICANDELQEILSRYKYRMLPLKYRVLCTLEKKKMAFGLFLVTQMFLIANRKKVIWR